MHAYLQNEVEYHFVYKQFLSFSLPFRAESSPALQTSSMLDCLAIIKTIISFLQKSSSEQNVCNLFDQLALSCIQKQDINHHKDFNQSLVKGQFCGSSYLAAPMTVKSWNNLMIELLTDLCVVLFDGM